MEGSTKWCSGYTAILFVPLFVPRRSVESNSAQPQRTPKDVNLVFLKATVIDSTKCGLNEAYCALKTVLVSFHSSLVAIFLSPKIWHKNQKYDINSKDMTYNSKNMTYNSKNMTYLHQLQPYLNFGQSEMRFLVKIRNQHKIMA